MAKIYGNRWQISEGLGEGGQAHTFLVKDVGRNEGTLYVLKRLKNINRIKRFEDEVKAVKSLTHENIVTLIDFDLEGDQPYLVTEYCSGGNLANVEPFWREQPLMALQLFKQICEGVAYAHANNIVHRDIKPDNIFLRNVNGPAVVGDFGICHLEKDGSRVTLTDEAVGARGYTAPELEDGRVNIVSKKSDTYSLGKLLYWLLSGRGISREQYRDREWDLRKWNPTANGGFGDWDNIYMEHVNRLLDKMIVIDPNERFHVDSIALLTEDAMRLIKKEYNPIAKDIDLPRCLYCGQGFYVLRAEGDDTDVLRSFGINRIGEANWRVLVCNTCGHIQTFRIEKAQRKDWWE